MRGVPILPRREEFVSHMVQIQNDVVMRDVPIKLLREEFVSHTARSDT